MSKQKTFPLHSVEVSTYSSALHCHRRWAGVGQREKDIQSSQNSMCTDVTFESHHKLTEQCLMWQESKMAEDKITNLNRGLIGPCLYAFYRVWILHKGPRNIEYLCLQRCPSPLTQLMPLLVPSHNESELTNGTTRIWCKWHCVTSQTTTASALISWKACSRGSQSFCKKSTYPESTILWASPAKERPWRESCSSAQSSLQVTPASGDIWPQLHQKPQKRTD